MITLVSGTEACYSPNCANKSKNEKRSCWDAGFVQRLEARHKVRHLKKEKT